MTPREVLALCREKDVKAVDLRFTDLLGSWHHFTIPVERLNEDVFEDGLGFHFAGVRGWQGIHETDLLLVPEPETAFLDGFAQLPTLVLICNIQDPLSGEEYDRDPRSIARKAVGYLQSTGIADSCRIGSEPEFFVFDEARFDQSTHEGYYHLDAAGGSTSSTARGKPRRREGGFPAPPVDHLMDLRNEMTQSLLDADIEVESQHHGPAAGPQCEINLGHASPIRAADAVMIFKHVVKSTARRHGQTVTFMPKPLLGDRGSGMHVHLSLWKGETPLFAGGGHAGLSDVGLHAVGGILRHAAALMAFTNPTTNGYKRLVPGYEAPVDLAYAQRNDSAAIRIPMAGSGPKSKRLEFRCPDPSCNPYLAFSAILLAAIDGIQNKFHPGKPLEMDLHAPVPLAPSDALKIPRTLDEALSALERDHEFLLRGDVFTSDVIRTWVAYKRKHEIEPMRLHPHPYEFCLYFDA